MPDVMLNSSPASSHKVAIPFYRQEHCNGGLVYEFPVATLTGDLKLDGLKQQKSKLSQFWRPEV